MTKPVAVIISDIHYSLPTLALADAALRQAIEKANTLRVPLIVAGDLHDTKANMRAECVNAMLATFGEAEVSVMIMVGNHDKINEKSEEHSLNFLSQSVLVHEDPWMYLTHLNSVINLIPYQHDVEALKTYLLTLPKGSTIIMHQGITGSNSGDYIQDKTAIDKSLLADFRVISGHYHTRRDIKCGKSRAGGVGTASYIGNPYTLNYGEATDPEKGFRILNDDGSLDFVPTNLRKHVVITGHASLKSFGFTSNPEKGDLVKIKLTGSKEELNQVNKEKIASSKLLPKDLDFKLELIPIESEADIKVQANNSNQPEVIDSIIQSLTNTSDEQKERIKSLWRALCE